jgi:hypothetical protein
MTHSGHVSDEFRGGAQAGSPTRDPTRNRSPASVRPTLRVVRRKSAAPTRPLSTRTAWLIADGVTPKLRGCSAKVAVLGNAQERLHAVERAPCRTVKFCFMPCRHYRE